VSYSESQLKMIERQCEGWAPTYLLTGPFGMKISAESDPARGTVIKYIGAWQDKLPMDIWMDGRPHPSKYAEHTRGGFTTGSWDGTTLVTRTTHIKANFLRKNGPLLSDFATMTNRFFRHGNLLTLLGIVEDPIYLAEPVVWTRRYQVSPLRARRATMHRDLRRHHVRARRAALSLGEEAGPVPERDDQEVRHSLGGGPRIPRNA
jgi:hypothetical protein